MRHFAGGVGNHNLGRRDGSQGLHDGRVLDEVILLWRRLGRIGLATASQSAPALALHGAVGAAQRTEDVGARAGDGPGQIVEVVTLD